MYLSKNVKKENESFINYKTKREAAFLTTSLCIIRLYYLISSPDTFAAANYREF